MARCCIAWLVFLSGLLPFVTAEKEREFVEGRPLVVNCNAKVLEHADGIKLILVATLSHVDARRKAKAMMGKIVFRRRFIYAKSYKNEEFLTNGWQIDQPKIDELNGELSADSDTRKIMSIAASKTASRCSDGGVYECHLGYVTNKKWVETTTATHFTGRSLLDIDQIYFSPANPVNSYKNDVPVTITCIGFGPEECVFVWDSSCGIERFKRWPGRSSKIKMATRQLATTVGGQTSDCKTFRHTQDVSFVTNKDLNNCELICKLNKNKSVSGGASRGVTIYVSASGDPSAQETSVLSITCNADTAGIDTQFTVIDKVTLFESSLEMASIQLNSERLEAKSKTAPSFISEHHWLFNQPSVKDLTNAQNVSNIRKLMSIIAVKSSVGCSDGGRYKCSVQYFDNVTSATVETETRYMVDGIAVITNLTFHPTSPGNKFTERQTVAAKCVGLGPKVFTFKWESTCGESNIWPGSNGKILKPTIQLALDTFNRPSDCKTYKHIQVIDFYTATHLNNCTIICMFGERENNFQEASKKITLYVMKGASLSKKTRESASNFVMIMAVALIVTAILLIAIIAIIVCICKKRKKRQEDPSPSQDTDDDYQFD